MGVVCCTHLCQRGLPGLGRVVVRVSDWLNRATYSFFGAGDKAPVRVLLAGRDRYARGEQEFTTAMRAISTLAGDEPPFRVEALAAENWTRAIDGLTTRENK